jgi:hypothetical protein
MQGKVNENCYTMTFGGDYGYKDGADSMILSACAESIILSVLHAETMILSVHAEADAESMILSAHAESLVFSAHAIILSACASVCAESINSQRALRVSLNCLLDVSIFIFVMVTKN